MSKVTLTQNKILDAAEKLFASDGYHNTSLRAITGEAEVNLASVNYHFGSKDSLLKAVFERRLRPLNENRMKELEKVREDAAGMGKAPGAGDVMKAFLTPVMRFHTSPGNGRTFHTLIGRTMAEPDATVRHVFMEQMRPVFLLTFELLCEALPRLSRDTVFFRLHFAIGAMSRGMCLSERTPLLPDGIDPAEAEEEQAAQLLAFVTAGLEAP